MPVWFAVLFLTGILIPDATQDLVRLEQKLTDALVRNDVANVERLWADDLMFVGTDGKSSTKTERLASMKAPASPAIAVLSATNDEVKVRLYGETAVVTLLSTWNVRVNDRDSSNRYSTTHVWTRKRGRWLLVTAHVSRVAP
jgi:ketosteroid isomerase-like protein